MNVESLEFNPEQTCITPIGSDPSSGFSSHQNSNIIFKDSERELYDLCSLEDSHCSGLFLGSRFDEIPSITPSKTTEDVVKTSSSTTYLDNTVTLHSVKLSWTMEVLTPSVPTSTPKKPSNTLPPKPSSANTAISPFQPPAPPPFKSVRSKFVELRSPVVPVQIAVRRLSLGCGSVGQSQEDYVLELCLALIDRACSLRHIPARTCAKTNPALHHFSTQTAESDGYLGQDYLEKVSLWMNDFAEKRHDRTTEVLRVCLEGCRVCVARASSQCEARRLRLAQRLSCGCFLPLIEEGLTVCVFVNGLAQAIPGANHLLVQVGIEDMLRAGSLFPQVPGLGTCSRAFATRV